MNAIMIENQSWYCDICGKPIIFKGRLRHLTCKKPRHEKNMVLLTVDKECEFFKPENDKVNYILNDTIKKCGNKFFHSFEYRCVYDLNFINMEGN